MDRIIGRIVPLGQFHENDGPREAQRGRRPRPMGLGHHDPVLCECMLLDLCALDGSNLLNHKELKEHKGKTHGLADQHR